MAVLYIECCFTACTTIVSLNKQFIGLIHHVLGMRLEEPLTFDVCSINSPSIIHAKVFLIEILLKFEVKFSALHFNSVLYILTVVQTFMCVSVQCVWFQSYSCDVHVCNSSLLYTAI